MTIALDPERVESRHIAGAVRVSALWVQQALNATGDYDLDEDGVPGDQTFAALYDFAERADADVEPRAGLIRDDDEHVVVSRLLEASLAAGGRIERTSPSAWRPLALGGALAVLVGGLWWFSRR